MTRVGDVRLEWSRPLPSVPSSATVIREADGRYYASFVVEVEPTPLPESPSDVGIDLGLDRLLTTSDGEVVENPRHLRSRQRRLARAQRALARKTKGSANRGKAVRRVAVHHRKVRETRLDHHHKLALRLVRDNQAVHAETLNIAGLARTRLARSVHDAGWGILLRLIEEKAARYGRTFTQVDRWFPSSQICSACGERDGPKPLHVREWTCPACGVLHDRDHNAAKNILMEGRRVAAGRKPGVGTPREAETGNARGAQVRPASVPAQRGEAGTHLGAA